MPDSTLPAATPSANNALLISCIDMRLMADIVNFMADVEGVRYTNRYDHFIMAGCSLGPILHHHWQHVLFDHVGVASKLHDIREIFLLEHRNCGAYIAYLPEREGSFPEATGPQPDPAEREREAHAHGHFSHQLEDMIDRWADQFLGREPIKVRRFLMDLCGCVSEYRNGAMTPVYRCKTHRQVQAQLA